MTDFISHLLDQDLLAKETLCEALALQLEEAPSAALLFYDQNWLSRNEFLEILNEKCESGESFIELVEKRGKLPSDFHSEWPQILYHSTPTLYSYLIKVGVKPHQLVQGLDEFIATLEAKASHESPPQKVVPSPPPKEEEIEQPEEVSSAPTEKPEPKLEKKELSFEFSFPTIDSYLVKEFLSLFTKNLKVESLKLITSLEKPDHKDPLKEFETLKAGFRPLREKAIAMNLEISSLILTALEDLSLGPELKDDVALRQQCAKLFKSALDELYFMKVYLDLARSEKSYWESQVRHDAFLKLVREKERLNRCKS